MTLDLERLKALAAAATPGPWEVDWHEKEERHWDWDTPPEQWPRTVKRVPWGIASPSNEGRYDILETDSGVYGPKEADAEFIAAAREAIPALVAEIERLRGLLHQARPWLQVASFDLDDEEDERELDELRDGVNAALDGR